MYKAFEKWLIILQETSRISSHSACCFQENLFSPEQNVSSQHQSSSSSSKQDAPISCIDQQKSASS